MRSLSTLVRTASVVLFIASGAPGCGSRPAEPAGGNEPGLADFVGGTRLAAVLAEAKDGTGIFLHWRDTLLGVNCAFEPVDGGYRCLPKGDGLGTIVAGVGELFADAACTRPAIRGPVSGGCGDLKIVQRLEVPCPQPTSHYRIGERAPPGTGHRKTETGCEPVADEPEAPLFLLEPVGLEAFVGAASVVTATNAAVARIDLRADDGSRMPMGFQDPAGGFACWPQKTSEGMRCVPVDVGHAGRGVYADARCAQPAALRETCHVARAAIPFVLFDPHGLDIEAIHRGGARLPEAFMQVDLNGCSEGRTSVLAYAVGEGLPLSNLMPASLSQRARPSGLVQTVARVGDLEIPRFDIVDARAFGGHRCTLATTQNEAVRCVPELIGDRPDYSDPACTQVVWQADFDRVAVLAADPEERVCRVDGLRLPRVQRVLVGGTEYRGPVYRKAFDGLCTLVDGVPNARQPYRRFAAETPLADLVEMPIKMR